MNVEPSVERPVCTSCDVPRECSFQRRYSAASVSYLSPANHPIGSCQLEVFTVFIPNDASAASVSSSTTYSQRATRSSSRGASANVRGRRGRPPCLHWQRTSPASRDKVDPRAAGSCFLHPPTRVSDAEDPDIARRLATCIAPSSCAEDRCRAGFMYFHRGDIRDPMGCIRRAIASLPRVR